MFINLKEMTREVYVYDKMNTLSGRIYINFFYICECIIKLI